MSKPRRDSSLDPHTECQRLDVWLFRTRLLKTRSLATKMILKGKVRITRNGQTERTVKAHVKLRPGDRALFMRGDTLMHVEMLAVAERRGPAREAQTLYRLLPLGLTT